MCRVAKALWVLVLLLAFVGQAAAVERVALVIGNSAYEHVGALPNPRNDATDISATLRAIGFSVRTEIDVTNERMRRALGEFSHDAAQADIAIVFYAGHGIEVDKHNYLLPTDAMLQSDLDVAFQTVPLDLVLDAVRHSRKLSLVFLDACRNNPFASSMRLSDSTRSIGRGLSPVEPVGKTIVFYSARDGTVASDGSGRNSPYSQALLKYLPQQGLELGMMIRKVTGEVMQTTNQVQQPFSYGSLTDDDIYLAGPQARSAVSLVETSQGAPTTQAAPAPVDDPVMREWSAIQNTDSTAVLQTFIEAHGDSVFSKYAQAKLTQLQQQQQPYQVSSAVPGLPPLQSYVQPQPPPPQQRWYLATYANTDFYGGDLFPKGVPAGSMDQCAQICAGNRQCNLFTYNSEKNRCFPKSTFMYVQIISGARAGYFYKSDREDALPQFTADWELFQKADLPGGDNYGDTVSSFDDCMSICKADQSCQALSYIPFKKRNNCWIKSAAAAFPVQNHTTARGIVSARRVNVTIRAEGAYQTTARD